MMTNIDRDLILHWVLDAVSESRVTDRSGQTNHGLLRGAPTIIADTIFGYCLRFHGGDDALTLNPMLDFPEDKVSVCSWVKSSVTAQQGSLLSYANDEDDNAFSLIDHNDLKVHIGRNHELDTGVSSSDGQWHHIAVCWRGSDGQIVIYRDGAVAHQGALAPGERIRSGGSLMIGQDQDTLGGKTDPAQAFSGELANLRIYQRMLSASEIEQVMLADVAQVKPANVASKQAAEKFKAEHPLDFQLLDEDNNNTIYIDNHHEGRALYLEVTNVSPQSLVLAKPKNELTGPENYHFELLFRPGTLAQISIDHLLIDRRRWALDYKTEADGIFRVFLLSQICRTLHPGQKLTIELNYVSAASLGSYRATQVEMKFNLLHTLSEKTTLSGYLNSPLQIIDLRGLVNIPLHIGFVGGNTILNRGAEFPHTLILEISNAAMVKTLTFSPEGSEASSRLILSADVQPPEQRREWALGTVSEVAAIVPEIDDPLWKKTTNEQGESPEWIFIPTQETQLKPGEMLRLTLNNVISSLPSGSANIYLRYEHIPGYRDGQFVLPITKGPLSIKDMRDANGNFTGQSRVGINTTAPRSALDIGLGLISGAAHDYSTAQFTISGGGTITWGGPGLGLRWTQRFIASGMENSRTFSDGYVDINMPSDAIPAEHVYNEQPRAISGNGIVLNNWEALYAVHEPGQSHQAVSFRIVNRDNPFYAAGNWLLVAVVNGDDGTVKLGTGLVLSAGSSSSEDSPIPVGTIVMWAGQINTIPNGWALCNGQNGTPNLVDRFIVGAGSSYGVDDDGGVKTVTLNANQMPVHDHSASSDKAGRHSHWIEGTNAPGLAQRKRRIWGTTTVDLHFGGGRDSDPNDTRWRGAVNTDTDSAHRHGITVKAAGGSQPHENRPPYYALALIMKL